MLRYELHIVMHFASLFGPIWTFERPHAKFNKEAYRYVCPAKTRISLGKD